MSPSKKDNMLYVGIDLGTSRSVVSASNGSRNWVEGVQETGRARTVNREKLQVEKLTAELNDPESFRARIFFPYLDLIKIRKKQSAFHPNAGFEIMELNPTVFGIKRYSKDQTIYALTNISSKTISVSLPETAATDRATDLISGETVNTAAFDLDPYQYVWLEEKGEKI